MGDEAVLFDPDFLGRLRALFLRLRKRRRLGRHGAQEAPVQGFTREFKDFRAYVPGDDVHSIDWRLYARLGRLFIRVFEEIKELHVHLLLDRSRSMAEPHGEKRRLALRLAAALAYLALVGRHRVSLWSFGSGLRRELPPRSGPGQIRAIVERLAALACDERTSLDAAFREFSPGRDRRGIVFVLSDLFGGSAGETEAALRRTASWPAETHVVHLFDPRERAPELRGETRLVEVETGEVRLVRLTDQDLALHARAFDAFREELRQSCLTRQVDLVGWPTDLPFEETFLRMLSRGSALAQA